MQKVSFAEIDLRIFHLINGYAKKSSTLDFFGIFCAKYLGYVMIFVLAFFSYNTQNASIFFLPMATGLVSLALNEIVYLFYKKNRPAEVIFENILISKVISPSFPSSHASFFFALSFTLFLFFFPLAIIFLIISFLISLARIFCGAHWPMDIVGGIGSAFASFLVIWTVLVAVG